MDSKLTKSIKMAVIQTLQVRITKYLMCICRVHMCICTPNMKFLCLTLCKGQVCTDCQGLNCIVIHEIFVTTELPNDELSGIHTPDLPHLFL